MYPKNADPDAKAPYVMWPGTVSACEGAGGIAVHKRAGALRTGSAPIPSSRPEALKIRPHDPRANLSITN